MLFMVPLDLGPLLGPLDGPGVWLDSIMPFAMANVGRAILSGNHPRG